MATRRIVPIIAAQDKARLTARLERNILRGTETDCIEYVGARNWSGYSKINFRLNGVHTQVYAHRLFWTLANKREIPSNMVVDHTCQNRCCVNPAHLQLVKPETNAALVHIRARKAAA
jgi:hypothetical protein